MKRIVISALSGSTGKTLITLGLIRAFVRRGLKVRAFKKGPDYIDTAWHAVASGREASNLDLFFMPENKLRELFVSKMLKHDNLTNTTDSGPYDLAVIEGNRGLFDGLDVQGSCSTASLAKALKAPTILLINATKMTRTTAALVNGCASFDKDLPLAGVIANRTGGERHGKLLAECVRTYSKTPFLGCLPRLKVNPILERDTGLISMDELPTIEKMLDELAEFMEAHLDMEQILAIASQAEELEESRNIPVLSQLVQKNHENPRPRIGYVRDSLLWFLYQDNLEALEEAGAELHPLKLMEAANWPELDGLYLPGGPVEAFGCALKEKPENWIALLDKLALLSREGLPVYAEGVGAWLTVRQLVIEGQTYLMSDIFPVKVTHGAQKRGLGYVQGEALGGPFFTPGTRITGHEFNYAHWEIIEGQAQPAYKIHKGSGMGTAPSTSPSTANWARDGLFKHNVQASITQLHALANPDWAVNFLRLARERQQQRS